MSQPAAKGGSQTGGKTPTPPEVPPQPATAAVQAARQTLLTVSAKMETQLALTGKAFRTVDKLYAEAILQDVEAALKTWDVLEEKERGEEKQMEEKVRTDQKALRDKVRAFDRKYGGHYGTGF